MDYKTLPPKIIEKIIDLEEKYNVMGQDLSSYLDGLLYSDFLQYWDYINLDTLLSLQQPKTPFPDEVIFIIYHQITELYFKLILWEMSQIQRLKNVSADAFMMRVKRINAYFTHLAHSFSIMSEGMEKEQFLKFRMSLLPASGFQSAQYRFIEINATDLKNLVTNDLRLATANASIEEQYENIYWKKGATELASGKKTLTLRKFEEKYGETFLKKAYQVKESNLWQIFIKNFKDTPQKSQIINELKELDVLANVNWPLAHYKSAVRYLQKDPEDISATGGTNWQKYLPPRFQKVIFYPELWSEEEMETWGKSWVVKEVFNKK